MIRKHFMLSKSRFDVKTMLAKFFVKREQRLVPHLLRVLYPIGGRLSPNWARLCYFYLKELNRLYRSMGIPGVVKYLKVCSVLVQQVCAGYRIHDLGPLGMRVSRSKSGLPRIIPAYQRKLILSGVKKATKFWLTLLSLYRDLSFPGTLKLKTIYEPSTAKSSASEISKYSQYFTTLYWKENDLDFSKAGKMFPMLTSGPQASRQEGTFNSHFQSVYRSFDLFHAPRNVELKKSLEFLMSYMNCSCNDLWVLLGSKFSLFKKMNIKTRSGYLGSLSIKEEAAGKVRVFAMVDPWTQWTLHALHKKLFHILSRMETDGTFNQLKPLMRVPYGKRCIYSFDLSAATDRLPIDLQISILSSAYGKEFAHHWANLLVGREYRSPSLANSPGIKVPGNLPRALKYSVGQPMGALSSWGMLAITHHYILHYCAWTACVVPVGSPFTEYAVLGDDMVIWNDAVARKYLETLDILGVEVGLAKSIISKLGKGLEFAKKTLLEGIDVSPVPFKEMSSAHMSFSNMKTFARKYNMSFLSILRFLGYGYKVDPTKKSSTVRALKVAYTVPDDWKGLLNLFSTLDRGYYDIRKNILYPRQFVNKCLVKLVKTELELLKRRSRSMQLDLVAYQAGLYVSGIGPWANLNARVHYETSESLIDKYLRDLEYVWGQSKLLLSINQDIWEFYDSFMWDLPHLPRQALSPMPQDFKAAMNGIFRLREIMDSVQIDLIMNPRPGFSKSPTYMEEKRVLRLWNQWSMTLLKVGRNIDLTEI